MTASLDALLSPLGGFCSRRSLRGEEGEEGSEGEEGELVRVRVFSGEEETEVLQKKDEETLDGENTGEFEIATVQDMVLSL